MATIHVDGKEYQVDDADNLLQACLSLGIDIPYFCWHPALGSVGACRQCAVKQFNGPDDKKGRLVMSCRTPAANNTWISVDDAEAKAFRAGIIEFMMTNHPHDCPVCEEGGHCHLQDMTVMSGHSKRRYRFAKRTHNSQYLGSFIKHEPNRCIACYRCVRYYQDYADGRNFGVFGSHNHVYFGRITDGVLENEFSGNLVEVCPTGVFTDKTHSDRYNRKWDMLFAPSVCQQCAVGCNISPGERYGEIRRVENRYNGAVNHYFLCDRGRFGYGYVNAQDRPRQPQLRNGQELQTVTPEAAITGVTTQLREAQRIIGIGSPRASLEANFQLRELVGTDNFYSGMNATELALTQQVLDILQTSGARTPSLREMEDADAVFILGEDVTQTAPRISLAIRQASKAIARKLAANKGIPPWHAEAVKSIANDAKYPVFIASFAPTRLQDVAKGTYCATAEDIARLGFAVANAIDPQAPAVTDLKPELATQAQEIATALLNAERPLLVSGTGVESAAVLQATANIAQALRARGKNCELTLVVPEVNSLGAAMLGGKALETALSKLAENQANAVVILENDIYKRCSKSLVDSALQQAKFTIVLDHQRTATAAKATAVLSTASFAEGDGTVVSCEGRAQRFFQVYDPAYYHPDYQIRDSWSWLHAIQTSLQSKPVDWSQLDTITQACAQAVPALARIVEAAPAADFRVQGLKIARGPKRYSGRTALRANISVHEPKTSQDMDSALAFSMEGYSGPLEPGALLPFAWSPGWNSPAAWTKFQTKAGGSLKGGDPGVRLFDAPEAAAKDGYTAEIPPAFTTRNGMWRVLTLQHIFGSEELSSLAKPIQERIPAAYVAINPDDATQLGLEPGAMVQIKLPHGVQQLPAKIVMGLPVGTIGLPRLPEMPVLTGENWVEVTL